MSIKKTNNSAITKNDPKIINAWASYDWANSVYTLTISSAIFPIYYNAATRKAFNGEVLNFFGFEIVNTVLYAYSIAFSFLVIVFLAPLLSGIADFGGMKKGMMKFFVYLGSFGCIMLYFFEGKNIEVGIIGFILATIGWAGSLVFYNAYLPEIATKDKYDNISAKGFALGYVGSTILLIINLIVIIFPDQFFDVRNKLIEIQSLDENISLTVAYEQAKNYYISQASKIAFLTVGIWWVVFSQIAFFVLPGSPRNKEFPILELIKKGYKELKMVYNSLSDLPNLKRFLWSFLFYSMGVQTVMLLAASFGEKQLHLSQDSLIGTVLTIQLVAIAGAYLFAFLSGKYGNKLSLQIMIVSWIIICFGAFFTEKESQFYVLAFFVGMIMGGIQSLSRSTYSKLIPKDTADTTSYFSFYDVVEKLSVVIGLFTFGAIEQASDNMKNGTLALAIFFIIGFFLLRKFSLSKK